MKLAVKAGAGIGLIAVVTAINMALSLVKLWIGISVLRYMGFI